MSPPRPVSLPDGRIWLRLAEPEWEDPFDAWFAAVEGGHWNAPDSFPTLYLHANVGTARMQIERLLEGTPFTLDDIDDDAYVLVAARLPRDQRCADAVTSAGLEALGLPRSYPIDSRGRFIGRARCQPIGARVRDARLRGVWCISGAKRDGSGRELAWFPATRRSRARPVWRAPLPLGSWRYARGWTELGLTDQKEPGP